MVGRGMRLMDMSAVASITVIMMVGDGDDVTTAREMKMRTVLMTIADCVLSHDNYGGDVVGEDADDGR